MLAGSLAAQSRLGTAIVDLVSGRKWFLILDRMIGAMVE